MITLYSYFRSSTSYRVRIALNLKGLDYTTKPVDLLKDEQRSPEFLALNPHGGVPALDIDGHILTQSMVILEYLEERFPETPLYPLDRETRADARALTYAIATDVHALNNLSALRYLTGKLGLDTDAMNAWGRHWNTKCLSALETRVAPLAGPEGFVFDGRPGMFEVLLIPQLMGARRFETDVTTFPTLLRIEEACLALDAFQAAAPAVQPDAS